MIEQVKRIGIVLTIAILFTIFVFAMTNAIYPNPDYNDYCDYTLQKPFDRETCDDIPEMPNCRGMVEYTYDENGCPVEAKCNPCQQEYEDADERYRLVLFLVSSITGVIAILFGLYCTRRGEFWNVVEAGFLVGGLISLFVGTGFYYEDMARFLKPAVILIELIIVLLVTKKVMKKRKD